jgi:hypothetical protein
MAFLFIADQHVRVMALETGVNVSCDSIIWRFVIDQVNKQRYWIT